MITSNSSMGTHCCHPPKLLINAMMILSISGISIARHLMSWLGRLKLKSSIDILSLFVAVLRHTTQPVSKRMRHSLNPRQNGTATYTDKEGIRQQQLLAFIPRHHKHYILPNSVSRKVHFSPQLQTDPRENYLHAKSLQPSGLLRTSKMLMVRQLALLNRFFSSLLVPFLSTRLIFLNVHTVLTLFLHQWSMSQTRHYFIF
ncbi:uncharacterized protein LOC105798768 isoform X1 [Gossypium raimondii]|uniref:uncharacterized protein LOC105798768 isoform X1 n=1 Tax=Gossypium raimondii TaxID=29730 RepID=UPI00227A1179|nr:uncharacterized protein LOC105798768 isoform X1 [Gossypium raimondii]XP_052476357.1 uncharacterized protein LOC105798768 isoform X1 [Gossypium raimondii]